MTEEAYWEKFCQENKVRNPKRQQEVYFRLKNFLGREVEVNNASVIESQHTTQEKT